MGNYVLTLNECVLYYHLGNLLEIYVLINYDDNYIKELFTDLCDVANSKNLLQKKIGKDKTIAVKKRKNQIEAASNFKLYLDTRLGKPHILHGNLEGLYAIEINAHTRMIIKPVAEDLSAEALSKCDKVIIEGIIEYHGGKDEWLIP